MKPLNTLPVLVCLALSTAGLLSNPWPITTESFLGPSATQGGDKLVYADFETVADNRPMSNRGGYVQLYKYEESPSGLVRYKGAGTDSSAPDLVRLSKDSPNRAIAFDYELRGPNRWAGVGVEVHGLPDKDGKPAADDVSGFKFLTLQLYVTGVTDATVEFVSKGQGVIYQDGGPQMTFKVSKGINTYRVPLNNVNQPSYIEGKVNPKDVLKKLTCVNIFVSCGPCNLITGTVVVDNLVFQN